VDGRRTGTSTNTSTNTGLDGYGRARPRDTCTNTSRRLQRPSTRRACGGCLIVAQARRVQGPDSLPRSSSRLLLTEARMIQANPVPEPRGSAADVSLDCERLDCYRVGVEFQVLAAAIGRRPARFAPRPARPGQRLDRAQYRGGLGTGDGPGQGPLLRHRARQRDGIRGRAGPPARAWPGRAIRASARPGTRGSHRPDDDAAHHSADGRELCPGLIPVASFEALRSTRCAQRWRARGGAADVSERFSDEWSLESFEDPASGQLTIIRKCDAPLVAPGDSRCPERFSARQPSSGTHRRASRSGARSHGTRTGATISSLAAEALLIPDKGALCRACVTEVDARTADAAWATLHRP
jgi:hypothetical protein